MCHEWLDAVRLVGGKFHRPDPKKDQHETITGYEGAQIARNFPKTHWADRTPPHPYRSARAERKERPTASLKNGELKPLIRSIVSLLIFRSSLEWDDCRRGLCPAGHEWPAGPRP